MFHRLIEMKILDAIFHICLLNTPHPSNLSSYKLTMKCFLKFSCNVAVIVDHRTHHEKNELEKCL